ncbi:cytochrome c peroxidase [Undibacterium arcticum]|uniref:cytochrome c peroxidase n=1 Tax=Undibacterium arcticum TaxID=1762892 RepID=UPI003615AF9A
MNHRPFLLQTDAIGQTIIKTAFVVLMGAVFGVPVTEAQEPTPAVTSTPPVSLKTVPTPGPSQAILDAYVQDKKAVVQLGKALFWDTKVGSDNKTSCATCHFHAGADNRTKNQLSPGLLANDKTFQLGGPNYALKASDFPLTKHADVNDAASRISDINDVVGSQGVFATAFADTNASGAPDACTAVSDAVGHGLRIQRQRRQYAAGGTSQYADGHKRDVQFPQLLGWPG